MKIKIVAAALCAMTFAAPVLAQEKISLSEAIAISLSNHPQLMAAVSRVEAAKGREVQAAALPNPNLSLMIDQVPFNAPGNGNFMAGISQPLLPPGAQGSRVELSKLDTAMAELELTTIKRDLTAKIQEAYADLLFENGSVTIAKLDEEATKTSLKAAQARYQAGEAARSEVLKAEVESSRAKRAVSVAESRVMRSAGRLNILLGRKAQAPLAVQEVATPLSSFPALATLAQKGIEARPELRQAEVAVQREALQRRLAQSGLWTGTEVALAAGAIAGQPGFSTTLSVPIPFYRQQGEIAEAEASKRRAEAELDALRQQITLEVEEAYREATLAAQQVEQFSSSYLPQAVRLLDNAQQRYRLGEASGFDLIDARRTLRETRQESARAELEYRQALAKLERAVGTDLRQP